MALRTLGRSVASTCSEFERAKEARDLPERIVRSSEVGRGTYLTMISFESGELAEPGECEGSGSLWSG
jgi:hypothetical protein